MSANTNCNPLSNRRYQIINEVLNALTHGIGALLSIVALILLIFKGLHQESTLGLVAYIVYGVTMILLYLSSTLYHSLIFTKARHVFQVIDHSTIFLLIAGSYTPYCLIALKGPIGYALFAVVWTIALGGILLKVVNLEKSKKYSTPIYIAMGWVSVLALKPIYEGAGISGLGLLAAGGLVYTLGTLFYRKKEVPYTHVIWHLFVLGGSVLIFLSIYLCV